jgi:hypothetical protein
MPRTADGLAIRAAHGPETLRALAVGWSRLAIDGGPHLAGWSQIGFEVSGSRVRVQRDGAIASARLALLESAAEVAIAMATALEVPPPGLIATDAGKKAARELACNVVQALEMSASWSALATVLDLDPESGLLPGAPGRMVDVSRWLQRDFVAHAIESRLTALSASLGAVSGQRAQRCCTFHALGASGAGAGACAHQDVADSRFFYGWAFCRDCGRWSQMPDGGLVEYSELGEAVRARLVWGGALIERAPLDLRAAVSALLHVRLLDLTNDQKDLVESLCQEKLAYVMQAGGAALNDPFVYWSRSAGVARILAALARLQLERDKRRRVRDAIDEVREAERQDRESAARRGSGGA